MDRTMTPPGIGIATAETGDRHGAGDLRFRLRDATEAAHRRLDTGLAVHDLTRRTGYAAFLRTMQRAFVPLEARLEGVDAGFLPVDWPARRRVDALRADLSGLDAGPPARSVEAALPPLSDDEAPGLLYVLEGSRLGGQVLLRQVLASPDPIVRQNARFLRHGEGQRLWPSFAAWLGTRPESGHDAAIRGALRAFELFEAAQAAG